MRRGLIVLKKFTLGITLALVLGGSGVRAAGSEGHVDDHDFSFEGPFGSYDQEQLRRGLKYTLKFVPPATV